MTISRSVFLAVLLMGIATFAAAQSQPKELPWAVAEFAGGGDWAVRVPQLLVRDWSNLPAHRLSELERQALRQRFIDETLKALDLQSSKLQIELDRKKLAGTVPPTEPAATEKTLATLATKRQLTVDGKVAGTEAPTILSFRPVWSVGNESLPWRIVTRQELIMRTKASYVVTGTVRTVGSYVSARIELYSDITQQVLAVWEGDFAADEAPERVSEANDLFRPFLLGRPWAGLSVVSSVPGAKVLVAGVWHTLPWSSDELEPGTYELSVVNPGRQDEVRSVVLEPGRRASLVLDSEVDSSDRLVIETEPPGIPLYLDSRYLGVSPQTVDRPLATSRVRAQAEGWATAAWEVGPTTVSPSRMVMVLPSPPLSVPKAKDKFYLSLAAFSFSLTGSAFLGAWWDEQFKLQTAYANATPVNYENYKKAYDRYWWSGAAYAGGISLTAGLFVWMMFELGDYLGAAQASLP